MKKNHKASGGKADEFLPEPFVLCYGDEENARIYAVHLTTANQRQDVQSASCLCASLLTQSGRAEIGKRKTSAPDVVCF